MDIGWWKKQVVIWHMFFFDLICFFFGFKDGWIFVNGFLSQIGEFTNAMPLKLVSTFKSEQPSNRSRKSQCLDDPKKIHGSLLSTEKNASFFARNRRDVWSFNGFIRRNCERFRRSQGDLVSGWYEVLPSQFGYGPPICFPLLMGQILSLVKSCVVKKKNVCPSNPLLRGIISYNL